MLCVASLLVSGLIVGRTVGQEKENPIVAMVKTSVKDAGKPFTILVHLKVKDGAGEKFEAAFAKALTETRKEKGMLAYQLNRSTKNATDYVVYERWRDVAALEAHLKTAHIQALFATVGDLLSGPPQADVLVPAGE
jgi:quinol monooxygenase YgiN